jgi:hypothetical protein
MEFEKRRLFREVVMATLDISRITARFHDLDFPRRGV